MRKIKLVSILLSLCLIFTMVQSVMALDVNVPYGTTTVRIPLTVNTNDGNFTSVQFTATYSSGLTFSSMDWSTMFSPSGMAFVIPSTGSVYVSMGTSGNFFAPAANGDVYIGDMVFTYTGNADETIDIATIRLGRLGLNNQIVGEEFGPFNFDVKRQYSPYDLNKDGVVDLDDVTWAAQYLLAVTTDTIWSTASVADFTNDGRIDIEDIVLILANYTVPYY